jgi:hypothetical protein
MTSPSAFAGGKSVVRHRKLEEWQSVAVVARQMHTVQAALFGKDSLRMMVWVIQTRTFAESAWPE